MKLLHLVDENFGEDGRFLLQRRHPQEHLGTALHHLCPAQPRTITSDENKQKTKAHTLNTPITHKMYQVCTMKDKNTHNICGRLTQHKRHSTNILTKKRIVLGRTNTHTNISSRRLLVQGSRGTKAGRKSASRRPRPALQKHGTNKTDHPA